MKVVHKKNQTGNMNKCRQTPIKNDGSKDTEGTKGIRRLSCSVIHDVSNSI